MMIYRKPFKSSLLVLLWSVAIFHCAFEKATLHWHQIGNNSSHHHHHENTDTGHEHDFNHQIPDRDSHEDSSIDCCHIQGPLRGASEHLELKNTFKIIFANINYYSRKNFQDYKLQKSVKRTLDPPNYKKDSEILTETLHTANPPPALTFI